MTIAKERLTEIAELALNGRLYPKEANAELLAYAAEDLVREVTRLQALVEMYSNVAKTAKMMIESADVNFLLQNNPVRELAFQLQELDRNK